MDGAPVEARSLASIVSLASNPPAYPRNPTQKPLEPLVLYIVRVPGSKDVFLSPLKPPTKSSLSPESLNASLYFIHVAGPRDEEILECIQQEQQSQQQQQQQQAKNAIPQTSKLAILNRTRRKPVPGVATAHTQHEASPPLPPRPQHITHGQSQDADIRYEREREQEGLIPVETSPERRHSPINGSGSPGQPPWEPQPPILPPRPVSGRPIDEDTRRWSAQVPSSTPSVGSPSMVQGWRDQAFGTTVRASWDGGGRPLFESEPTPTRPQSHRGLLHIPEDEGPKPPLPLRPRKSYERPREAVPAAPFHLTLIRRDPTHSTQWNVGTIDNIGSSPLEGRPDGSIRVEIATPGYQKFAVDTSRMSFESLGIKLPASARSLDIARPPLSSMSSNMPREAEDISDSGPGPGPVKFTRLLKLSHPPQSSSHHRHHSSSHGGEMFNRSPPKPSKYPHRGNAHYHFTSIWNGHCNFVTAANGRTLKCKHTIPGAAGNSPSSAATTTVAEIRFNLPTLLPRPSSSGDQNSSPTKPSSWIGELDLSLARERAGGGLRGNSAKLGKIIIEDEGLKMLDLVVASCMGVFWKYYDNM
ncbi:hypothetical protein MGYG_00485 [Nannizzia gypsea CBS 118893]|uniref:Uncharacterized protein n=1 Tax=Arthroderma gypseum (strain ATCC MYA-4604 / CBS 118893) TaxID=535722 RepID=E5R033_ARTGP|nr:hypothetical protein MGYG_00485 [Nannizzia gypsea CBS 118893]EFQ97444.1 hypothetical protein MGYG_00485 [Nannizzia gypsea CBS 118893]